jgi:hypothetical protein
MWSRLTRADSAVGWSVLISTSTMTGTVRALADPVLVPLFTSPRRTIMGGSAPPRGRAVPVPGGYRITGRWTQGSNVRIAGWFHVGCHIWDGDRQRVSSAAISHTSMHVRRADAEGDRHVVDDPSMRDGQP